ncbi:hypothetical protein IGS68_29970 (plasmid) [Skermanella sp. TT6]|uniref:Major facilitator superfamily (MFS) profile domain-containing protein n=1 Tax=Skermanella cutis TaxID=2775420 RepID=A0ABX7BE77_9PROT|nr:MFS transporter [Skermanella sp. TT6]QQP92696.1 hypothetical protein IGS68_29970 [Skermanella sp. TT6]
MKPARRLPLLGTMLTGSLSVFAITLLAMALPWVLISGGHGTMVAGVAAFCLHMPAVIGTALGGRLIDRAGARRVLLLGDAGGLLAVLGAALLAEVPGMGLWPVVGMLALSNLAAAPGIVAQSARMPEIARLAGIPLPAANAWSDVAMGISYVAGPATAVLLVEAGGLPLVLQAAASILALVCLVDLATFPRFARRRRGPPSGASGRPARDPALAVLLALGIALVGIYASLDEILAPALVVAEGVAADRLALFLGILGATSLGSSLLFALVGHRLSRRRTFASGVVLFAAGLWALALLPAAIGLLLGPALIGVGAGPLSPIMVTAIQERVPAAARGHVLGRVRAMIMAAQPLAALAAGPAVAVLGPARFALALALAASAAAAVSALHPGMRRIDARSGPSVPP